MEQLPWFHGVYGVLWGKYNYQYAKRERRTETNHFFTAISTLLSNRKTFILDMDASHEI